MAENDERQEKPSIASSNIEAYYSDILPHHSTVQGYENAIPDGGKEVIRIVKRQQMMSFIYNMTSLFSHNLIPFILVLPILLAISAGAVIEITVASTVPVGLFTAGSAVGRVVTTWRRQGAVSQTILPGQSLPSSTAQLPPQAGDSDS